MEHLTTLLIIIGYFGVLIGLGIVSKMFFRGSSADYFVISRSVGSFLLLMSVFGTTMTGFALVGSTGEAYELGIGAYGLMASWSGLIHSAVFFAVGIRLWAAGKKYGYVTQCEYFRDRFQAPGIAYLLFPILVLLLIPYLLVGVIAAGRFLQATTSGMFEGEFFEVMLPNGNPSPLSGGLPPWIGGLIISCIVLFYIFFGGLRGAVWANTLQTLVFMVTGVIAFYVISTKLGGLEGAAKALADSPASDRMVREGHYGHLHFFSYFLIPLSVGMFPHLFQHWLTAKSAKTFRLTVVAHPIFIMIVWLPCILIGIWAAAQLGSIKIGDRARDDDQKFVHQRPGDRRCSAPCRRTRVLAAIMSSLDSQFMCLGTMFTNDIVVRLFGKDRFTDGQKVMIARCFIVAIVAVTFGCAAYLMGGNRSNSVFALGVWCFSGFAALFPITFAAVYWRRATKWGVYASILVTAAVWGVLFYRDIFAAGGSDGEHEKLIFGMMPVAIIFASSALAMWLVSLITKPPSDEVVAKFFPTKP
ncbi:MAG: sodium:solute symporter family protein [Verrucomicrobiales bacterium]